MSDNTSQKTAILLTLCVLLFAILFGAREAMLSFLLCVVVYLPTRRLTKGKRLRYNYLMSAEDIPNLTPKTEEEAPVIPSREELFPKDTPRQADSSMAGTVSTTPITVPTGPQTIITKRTLKVADTMRGEDWKKWLKNFFIFSVFPALVVLLQSLQASLALHQAGWSTPQDWSTAIGAAEAVLIASSIDLLGKFKSGI